LFESKSPSTFALSNKMMPQIHYNKYFSCTFPNFNSAGDNSSLNFIGNVLFVASDSSAIGQVSSVAHPCSLVVEPSPSVIAPSSSTVQPSRSVIAPSSSAVQPSHSVVAPSSLAIPPTRSVVEQVGSVIQQARSVVGRSPPIIHPSYFIVKKPVLATKHPY